MEQLFRLIVHDADTDIVVPDTGLFTADKASGGDSYLFGIMIVGACLVVIASVFALRIMKRKRICKFTCNSIVPILIAGITIAAPVLKNSFTNATIKNIDFSVAETVTTTIDREKGETSVVVPVDITLNETTPNGYDLYMYGGELTDGANVISQISGDNVAITTGTWGVVVGSESAPTIDDAVWGQIGSSNSPKKVSTADDEIAAGTTIRVYYGIAIDDSTPAGAYSTTIGFSTILDLGTTLEESYESAGVEKVAVGSNSYYPIQGMTTEICNNTTVIPDTLQVVDTRDNTIYTIGKLADNRCWLLDNLALDLTNENVKSAMYDDANPDHDTKTNATNEVLKILFDGGYDSGNPTTHEYARGGVVSTYDATSETETIPIINTDKIMDTTSNDTIPEASSWRYGVYYNYCAASAGTYCSNEYDTPSDKPNSAIDAEYDICPTGWRMPTGGEVLSPNGGEYQTLFSAIIGSDSSYVTDYVSYELIRNTLHLPLSGNIWDFTPNNYGWIGVFWSSTYYNDGQMYSLWINANDSSSDYSASAQAPDSNRHLGYSVRCIAK